MGQDLLINYIVDQLSGFCVQRFYRMIFLFDKKYCCVSGLEPRLWTRRLRAAAAELGRPAIKWYI